MRTLKTSLLCAAAAALSLGVASPALSAGKGVGVIDRDWSFEGPFGSFDRAELQRGWQVYMEVCSSCHAMHLLSFRHLGEPGGPEFPPEQVKAIAENFPQIVRSVSDGELTERQPGVNDPIIGPYSFISATGKPAYDEEAWSAANVPPDMSVLVKARIGYTGTLRQIYMGPGGTEYVFSLLMGYQDEPPEGFEVQGALSYNRYFSGHQIAMAAPLWEDAVEYQDGTPATIEQMAHDVAAFLTWAAEPKMEERKEAGIRNIIFLSLFAILVFYANRKLWKPVKEGGDAT